MSKVSTKYLIFGYLCFVFVYSVDCKGRELPPYIRPCKRNDPNINECILKVADVVIPHLPKGIKQMQIPPMEPLEIPKADLDTGSTLQAHFTNIKVYHSSEFDIRSLNVDLNNNKIVMRIFFPRMRIISDYKINGRLLILQLNGAGPADGNLTNIDAIAKLNGRREIRRGKEYIDFHDNKLDLDIGPSVFRFENLFENNPELTEATNKVINDNIEEIIKELKPVLEDTIAAIVFGITSRVFQLYPLDVLFPL